MFWAVFIVFTSGLATIFKFHTLQNQIKIKIILQPIKMGHL